MSVQIKTKTYAVNNINLHVAEAGDNQAPVILFLHGFPEFWYAWHQQLLYFGQNGFRAVAPDQRGYNLSSKPTGVKAYNLEILVADMVALIKALDQEKIILVGHDWGGAVAWTLAEKHPQLLHKLIILNMPHLQVMHHNLRRNSRQMLKSWYAGFFQIPLLPELFSRALGYEILINSMVKTALPGTFSPTDLQKYKLAWQQPGALTAMINWYRAYKYSLVPTASKIITPTLVIWGKKDAFLRSEMASASINQCRQGSLVYLEEATHWLHHERPQEVNKHILNFIQTEP